LTWYFDALSELIKEAVHNGNDINVPWIKIATLGRILQKTDGKACTGISAFVGDRLMQWNPFNR
jgi:hypothetical protein